MNDTDQQEDTSLTPYEGLSLLAVPVTIMIAHLCDKAGGIGADFSGVFFTWWMAAAIMLLAVTLLNFIVTTVRWPRG